MATYRIVRRFFGDHEPEVIETGLTLFQARRHCRDPETSSRTATSASARAVTAAMGQWFDAYEEERE